MFFALSSPFSFFIFFLARRQDFRRLVVLLARASPKAAVPPPSHPLTFDPIQATNGFSLRILLPHTINLIRTFLPRAHCASGGSSLPLVTWLLPFQMRMWKGNLKKERAAGPTFPEMPSMPPHHVFTLWAPFFASESDNTLRARCAVCSCSCSYSWHNSESGTLSTTGGRQAWSKEVKGWL